MRIFYLRTAAAHGSRKLQPGQTSYAELIFPFAEKEPERKRKLAYREASEQSVSRGE